MNWMNYWRTQEKLLDGMQEFARGWFERRHEGAKSAFDAAQRSCEAASPAAVMREFQEWMAGSAQRLASDCAAYQQSLMSIGQMPGVPLQPKPPAGEAPARAAAKPKEAQAA
jgi:hypothetical protein